MGLGGRGRLGIAVFVVIVVSLIAWPVPSLASPPTPGPRVAHSPIFIDGNADLTPANGVVSGRGTAREPYVIEGWEIEASAAHGIEIRNTDDHLIVRTTSISNGGSVYSGVYLVAVANVLVENVGLTSMRSGILVENSNAVTVNANAATDSSLEGVGVVGGSDVVVTQNFVSGGAVGISVYAANRVNVTWNRPMRATYGVRALVSSNVTIESNTMRDNGYGVSLLAVQDTAVLGNTIDSVASTTGIEALDLARVRIAGNTIGARSIWGIAVGTSSQFQIQDNVIAEVSSDGILVELSSSLAIGGNSVSASSIGIRVKSSANVALSANRMESVVSGMRLDEVSSATLSANTFNNSGLTLTGGLSEHFASHAIGLDNLVNGRPIRYFSGCTDATVDGLVTGQVIAAGCARLRLANLTLNDTEIPVQVFDTVGLELDRVTVFAARGGAVAIARTADVTLRSVNVSDSPDGTGVYVQGDGAVALRSVRIASTVFGAWISAPGFVELDGVEVEGPGWGIFLGGPEAFHVRNVTTVRTYDGLEIGNGHHGVIEDSRFIGSVDDQGVGIELSQASDILITRTNISTFRFGVLVAASTDVRVHHNRFQGNEYQAVDSFGSVSAWDDGYPSGGNVWSDYRGWDDCGGPDQDICPGSDGLGDVPYQIGDGSFDRYPIVEVNPPNQLPVAAFISGPAYVQEPVSFDASLSTDPDGWPLTFAWSFGDGGTSSGTDAIVSHVFMEEGTFHVTLTATDVRGASGTAALDVEVRARPPPPRFEFVEYEHGAGFRLPVPVNWTRTVDLTEEGTVTELILDGTFAGWPMSVLVDTERDPSVRETRAYLDAFVTDLLREVRAEYPDVSLNGSPAYRTIANHSAVIFTIGYSSLPVRQRVAFVVSEAHDRFWFLLLTAHVDGFAGLEPVFEEMLLGFEITLKPVPDPFGGEALAVLGGLGAAAIAAAIVAVVLLGARRARRAPPPVLPVPGAAVGLPPPGLPTTAGICPSCGTPAAPGVPFCPRCGTDMRRPPGPGRVA